MRSTFQFLSNDMTTGNQFNTVIILLVFVRKELIDK